MTWALGEWVPVKQGVRETLESHSIAVSTGYRAGRAGLDSTMLAACGEVLAAERRKRQP
jgi:hypothetical protein